MRIKFLPHISRSFCLHPLSAQLLGSVWADTEEWWSDDFCSVSLSVVRDVTQSRRVCHSRPRRLVSTPALNSEWQIIKDSASIQMLISPASRRLVFGSEWGVIYCVWVALPFLSHVFDFSHINYQFVLVLLFTHEFHLYIFKVFLMCNTVGH